MIHQLNCPVKILTEELSERMGANSQYSLRAFARDLKISAQQLSNFINGKKGLSSQVAGKIADRLNFNQSEKLYFQVLVQSRFARSRSEKLIAVARLKSLHHTETPEHNLSSDVFRVISDWYHFALVELLRIRSTARLEMKDIAKKLGIQTAELKQALSRLERLRIISKDSTFWKVEKDSLLTTDGVPSDSLKKFHRQVLEKAMIAISTQTVQERYLSTSMLCVRPEDYERASMMIQTFRQKFTTQMTSTPGTEVYALGIQYFRLTQ